MRKHAIILGVATLLTVVAPAVYARPAQTVSTPTQAQDLYQQAQDRYKSGDYKGAVENYNEFLRLNPTTSDPNVYVNRAVARFEMGDKNGAIEDFTQALTLNPNDAQVYRQRGGVYLILGQKKKARADFRQAAKLSGARSGTANSEPTLVSP